jgi:hypothetical protein
MKCRVNPTLASQGVTFCTRETGGVAITGGYTKKNLGGSNPRKDLLELGNFKGRHPGTWQPTGEPIAARTP